VLELLQLSPCPDNHPLPSELISSTLDYHFFSSMRSNIS